MAEKKTLALAGVRPSSDQLKTGLPIFFQQLLGVLLTNQNLKSEIIANNEGMAEAASRNDEPAMAMAAGRPDDAAVAVSAGHHGAEMLRLGYSLSHVVHAYGAMCQSITELVTKKHAQISPGEFRDLNLCLDVAIAGAVTEYQAVRNIQESSREVEHLGFLAHELRNALGSVKLCVDLIESGSVGFKGSTGQVLKQGIARIDNLINRSLTEVRLRIDPKIHTEPVLLVRIINELLVTAELEAKAKNQTIQVDVDPIAVAEADQQLVYSAVSNLVQNAIKFTHEGGNIQLRGKTIGDNISVEVEDECGGLLGNGADLFKPFEQRHANRKGLGLGLTISQRAINLNHGTIGVQNLPGKGCIFKITLPKRKSAPLPEGPKN